MGVIKQNRAHFNNFFFISPAFSIFDYYLFKQSYWVDTNGLMGNVVNTRVLNSERRSWDDPCKLSCVQKAYFHAFSGAASISAPKSKQKTASFIKMSLRRWRVLVPPVQPGGWGLKVCPDPPPFSPTPLTAPMAMFPPMLLSGELWVIKPSWDWGGAETRADITHPCLAHPVSTALSLRFPPRLAGFSRQALRWAALSRAEPSWAGADW